MAVSAPELRPRGAVALFDAAIRLVSRNGGVWAATLPGGALVTVTALHLVARIQTGGPVVAAALLFTAAWFFRGLCQVAASHQVHELLLSPQPASVWRSFRVALARTPRAFVATAVLTALNAGVLLFTGGVLGLFLAAPIVAYAVVAQGDGRPLHVLGTGARLLGPSRHTARKVRPLLWVFALLVLNLHIAANALLMIGSQLLGLQLTFAERFASLDNPTWDVALIAVAFTLFEPVRAAVGALLLVDGRVRSEGLDLLARVSQLPQRGARGTAVAAAVLALLLPFGARAAPSAQFGPRVEQLIAACELDELSAPAGEASRALELAGPTDRAHALRFLGFLEDELAEEEDCEVVRGRLARSLEWMGQVAPAELRVAASDRAKAILARPEFSALPEREPPEEKVEEGEGWWSRFWRWFGDWLERLFADRDQRLDLSTAPPRGDVVGRALVFVLAGLGLALLAWLLLRHRTDAPDADSWDEAEQRGLVETGPIENALSKPPEGWAELADQLAARGEFREGARTLYLAVLSRLHRDGAIDYETTASNWDYLRHFRGASALKAPFRELTLRFDFAVYGHFELGPDGYATFRTLAQPILAPSSSPMEAHVG